MVGAGWERNEPGVTPFIIAAGFIKTGMWLMQHRVYVKTKLIASVFKTDVPK